MGYLHSRSLTCAGEDVVEGAVDRRKDGAGDRQIRQRIRQAARLDGLMTLQNQ